MRQLVREPLDIGGYLDRAQRDDAVPAAQETVGLSTEGRFQARLLVLIRQLQAVIGLAVLLVSHGLAAVRKVTDRIVVPVQQIALAEVHPDRYSTASTPLMSVSTIATTFSSVDCAPISASAISAAKPGHRCP